MRLVFAGTPPVAIGPLDRLAAAGHDIVAVLTRPPKPVGRSRRPVPSIVETWARDRGIEVLSPVRPGDPALAGRLAALEPDCCPVVAYGGLIPSALLGLPRFGWINLHFSVLPAYRGAAPVQRALLSGDTVTGATTFALVAELDAGPVYRTLTEPIAATDTTGDLLARLADRGADLLVATLADAERGVTPTPQPGRGVTFAPKITVDEVRIDLTRPADEIDRLVRAANPEPGAWALYEGQRLKVLRVGATEDQAAPGRLFVTRRAVLVGTGTTCLRLDLVVPAGRKAMPGGDWARGARPGADAALT